MVCGFECVWGLCGLVVVVCGGSEGRDGDDVSGGRGRGRGEGRVKNLYKIRLGCRRLSRGARRDYMNGI